MTSFYLDTSLLVAAFTAEPMTTVAQSYLTSLGSTTTPTISDWSVTEFSAALSMKVRAGQLIANEQRLVLGEFDVVLRESFVCLPVVRDDFRVGAALAGHAPEGLRAGDALHLAIAQRAQLVIHTLDKRMCRAAEQLDLRCVLAATS